MKKLIVLIEDNKDVRENIAEILELAGYEVTTAEDGKKGVEAVKLHKPDLIICDIMMPVLDGYGVLHMLCKNEETQNIPFVFLTAKTERSEMRKGMEMGADDYITKPFEKIELLNAIEGRLKKTAALKKEFDKSIDGLNNFVGEIGGRDTLTKFTQEQKSITYKKKETIYKQGSFPKGVYYLKSGKAKVFKMNKDGKELITALLKEGDFFGYIDILENKDYSESSQALEPSEIIYIPREEFYKVIYNHQAVAKKFLHILTHNLIENQDHLLDLAYSSLRKRVAEALILLCDKFKNENEKIFSIAISRDDLASIVGTATESLIRTLSDFKEEKLIEIKEGKIFISNEDKLRNMKN
jgi:DNA-binding response OmpR family regulator